VEEALGFLFFLSILVSWLTYNIWGITEFWRIFKHAGFNPAWSLLVLIPEIVISLIVISFVFLVLPSLNWVIILFVLLLSDGFRLWFFARFFKKIGRTPWLTLFWLVPLINIIIIWRLAVEELTSQEQTDEARLRDYVQQLNQKGVSDGGLKKNQGQVNHVVQFQPVTKLSNGTKFLILIEFCLVVIPLTVLTVIVAFFSLFFPFYLLLPPLGVIYFGGVFGNIALWQMFLALVANRTVSRNFTTLFLCAGIASAVTLTGFSIELPGLMWFLPIAVGLHWWYLLIKEKAVYMI
jgi:hypothetical protein